ncbi:conjugal transfer protein TraG N-terminal domain-containing protein [Campylobacter iguaniorum]|nr:conjugal transfer protein TraG N-terminal domain-containing protein [Campylobacter iguaniorum]
MKKLFLALIVFSSGAYAAHNGVIYTWGYASLMNDILQAVKGAVTGIDSLVKSAMAIAFFIFAIKKAMDSRVNPVMEFGKLMLLFAVVSYFFLQAPDDDKHRFVIEDRVTGEMHTVSQIPLGIGKTFALVTQLEDGIAELMETHFSTPSSINYRTSGLGYTLSTHNTVSQLRVVDPYYKRTYDEYISECVFYDISSGVTDIGLIVDNDNLAGTIFNTASSRLTNKYTAGTPSGEVVQCSEAGDYLENTLGTYLGDVEKVAAATNGEAFTHFQDNAGAVKEQLFGTGNSTRDYVQQMALINMTSDAIVNSAKASGLDPSALAWASAVGDYQFTSQMQAQGMLAQKYLPKAKAYFTAIIVGIAWLIAILAILFGEYKHIQMFFTLMLWMVLWTPILLIINYFNDMNLRDMGMALINATGVDLTINHNRMIMNKFIESSNFVNWMVMVTPLLAYAIAKASEHGFVSLASNLSQSLSKASLSPLPEQKIDPNKPGGRVGNDVYGDIGGQISSQTQSMTNGHSWNDSTYTDKGTGTQTYSGQMTDGSGSIGMVGGQVVNAQSQMALSAAHKNTSTASTELSNAISSSSTSVLGSDKTLTQAQSQGLSTQDTHNITEAKGIAMSKAFEHMQGYGEDFNNLKRMAMQGGGNLSASILDGKVGASGGVVYSGVDQDGKKYSWTDNSKEAEQNFNQIQEQFSKVVSGNSSYQASYAEMLKVTDSESYSQVQNAMTKLSNAEMTETGLNANNLPAFLNNWINGDERFSRMPKVDAAKVAMGELSSLSANGEWGKISDLVGKYGSGGFEMNSNPNLAEPTKFNSPDIKGQYDTAAGNIQTQTNSALEQSKANAQGQMGEFKQENGGVQGQVEKSVSDGKKWGEQGLFSRFWDENKDEMLVGAVGLGAALGLTSAGAKKIGGEILDKFKNAKNVDELEELMKKTDQLDDALKNNSPEARKLMEELGLKDNFEQNGGVFNKDGSIEQTKTKLNQNLGEYARSTAKGDVADFVKNNAFDSKGSWYDDAKQFISQSIDDAWKGMKNISPSSVAHGVASVGTALIDGVPTNPTAVGDGTIIGHQIASGQPFIVGNSNTMNESSTWRDYKSDYNDFMAQNPNFNPQTQSVQGQLNNGQMEFNIVDKSDLVGKQVSDLQIQIKQLQKSSPSSSIPDSKGGKGEVL